jgi:hypothetical protein
MPSRWEPLRVPAVLFLVSLLCVVTSLRFLAPSTREVAAATATIEKGRCGLVPGLETLGLCHGIVLLELAPDRTSAQQVVDALRAPPDRIEAAETNVRYDYLFIPSYVAFLGFLGMTAVRLREVLCTTRPIAVLYLVVGLQLAAGILDGVENVGLFRMLEAAEIPQGVPGLTSWAARIKWWLAGAGLIAPTIALVVMLPRLRKSSGATAGASGRR